MESQRSGFWPEGVESQRSGFWPEGVESQRSGFWREGLDFNQLRYILSEAARRLMRLRDLLALRATCHTGRQVVSNAFKTGRPLAHCIACQERRLDVSGGVCDECIARQTEKLTRVALDHKIFDVYEISLAPPMSIPHEEVAEIIRQEVVPGAHKWYQEQYSEARRPKETFYLMHAINIAADLPISYIIGEIMFRFITAARPDVSFARADSRFRVDRLAKGLVIRPAGLLSTKKDRIRQLIYQARHGQN